MSSLNSKRAGGFSRFKGTNTKGSFGDQPSFGGRKAVDTIPRSTKKYSGTCAGCQKRCEALFMPTREKPLYCSDCFAKKSGDKK
jgi:CxxC-x17-CxxC domain-containing protein